MASPAGSVVDSPAVPVDEGPVAPGRNAVHQRQAIALVICLVLLAAGASFVAGFKTGLYTSWSYLDVATVERRMREVFCEQAIRNGMIKACSPDFARAYTQ